MTNSIALNDAIPLFDHWIFFKECKKNEVFDIIVCPWNIDSPLQWKHNAIYKKNMTNLFFLFELHVCNFYRMIHLRYYQRISNSRPSPFPSNRAKYLEYNIPVFFSFKDIDTSKNRIIILDMIKHVKTQANIEPLEKSKQKKSINKQNEWMDQLISFEENCGNTSLCRKVTFDVPNMFLRQYPVGIKKKGY